MSKLKSQHGVRLHEEMDTAVASLDRDNGVIRGVKIIGPESRNNRRYSESALRKAANLYEGQRVNVNHGRGSGDRALSDRFGKLVNVHVAESGLVGDLHYFKTHAMARQVEEAVERPDLRDTMGLSHNAEGRTRREGGKQIVEEILAVHSVDLVADPATTKSLFESEGDSSMDEMGDGAPVAAASGGDMTLELLVSKVREIAGGDGDGMAKAKKVYDLAKVLFGVQDKIEAAVSGGDAAPAEAAPAVEAKAAHVGELQEAKRKLEAAEAKAAAYELLTEARRFPRPEWVTAVAAVPAEKRKALIESLPEQPIAERPSSRSPLVESKTNQVPEVKDAKDFARVVLGR